jgi:hypothetical protein
MPQRMVGLLAAVGAAMSALVGLAHGALVWIAVADAAAATGLAAYLALSPIKKSLCVYKRRQTRQT